MYVKEDEEIQGEKSDERRKMGIKGEMINTEGSESKGRKKK